MKLQEFKKLILEEVHKVLKEEEGEVKKEIPLILSKDEDFDRVKRALRTDPKFGGLDFTHWERSQPLGSIRGFLITMYFANTKNEVVDFIKAHNIKVANRSFFDLTENVQVQKSNTIIGNMKASEFKKLIREEVRTVLNEGDRYDTIAKTIKYDPKKVKAYKVGKGTRRGVPVDVAALKQVIGRPLTNIEYIERVGKFKFDTAYANIQLQEPSYRQRLYDEPGSGKTLTYSLFGEDSAGNKFIYDKYEGATAGGGQAFLFINGKKMQVSQYIYLKGKID